MLCYLISDVMQTLVFSNSTKMLNVIESYVTGRGWRFWYTPLLLPPHHAPLSLSPSLIPVDWMDPPPRPVDKGSWIDSTLITAFFSFLSGQVYTKDKIIFCRSLTICLLYWQLSLSTKAGGLGLNLTSASKVVIFDCNWNPALDMQVVLPLHSSLSFLSSHRLLLHPFLSSLSSHRPLFHLVSIPHTGPGQSISIWTNPSRVCVSSGVSG